LDTEEYLDILNYFITESNHPGYKGMPLPDEFPKPVFVEDEATESNTDNSGHSGIENEFIGGTYFFSTAQDPTKENPCPKTALRS